MIFVVRDQISHPLNAYVDNLYYLRGAMPYHREKVFPTTTLDLKINLGDAVGAFRDDQSGTRMVCETSWCVGTWGQYHIVEWPTETHLVGVTFKAAGAYAVFGVPLHEFRDQIVPLDAIWGPTAASEVRERLGETATPEERLRLMETMLASRPSGKRPGLDLVQYALKRIAQSDGTLTIRGLCEEVGVSARHLDVLFKRVVGSTPKELTRVRRFNSALEATSHADSVDLTSIAHANHYFDQSHFCRDFRAFTGESPSDYMKERRRLRAESPDHSHHVRLMATA